MHRTSGPGGTLRIDGEQAEGLLKRVQRMRRTGFPRGMPWIDGEQAEGLRKRVQRMRCTGIPQGIPRIDGEQATPAQQETTMPDKFRPLSKRVGAETTVRRDEIMEPAFIAEALESLEHYGVLIFHRLGLTDEEQVAFSSQLGQVIPQGKVQPDGSRDVIFKITLDEKENDAAEYLKSTIHWHIDGIFDETPPVRATILTGRRLSKTGGATEFCNTYAAYNDLSPEEQRRCDSLRIMHSLVASHRVWNPESGPEETDRWRRRRAPKEHPLVWQHRSGRKSIVIGMTVDHVVGMSEAESRTFMQKLTAHTTRPENVYHHDWEIGDLVIWDNCGTMHRATPYDPASGRMMHRTVLLGTESIA